MKKKHIFHVAASALILLGGCAKYDDSNLWNDVDHLYTELTTLAGQLDQLNGQIALLSSVTSNGVITNVTVDAQGHTSVSYKGSDNVEHTVVIATKDDVVDMPVIGTKEDGGVLYWTITTSGKTEYLKDNDGARIPVAGRTPKLGVDKDGYWTVNGLRITGADGKPVKAEGKKTSLITAVAVEDNIAKITLADGTEIAVNVFGAFGVVVKVDGKEVEACTYTMEDSSSKTATFTYEVKGENAENTTVKLFKTEVLKAVQNEAGKTIVTTWEDGFEQGSFTIIVADNKDNVLIRKITLIAGDVKPSYYGIKTADDFLKFAQAVNTGASLKNFMDESGTIVLLSDVDMTGMTTLPPVGLENTPFTGTFDGKGYALKNVNISYNFSSVAHCGIFGYAKNATIKNLTVGSEGSKLTADGQDYSALATIAGVLGYSDACSVEGCTNNCEIITTKLKNTGSGATGVQVAGIVGFMANAEDVVKNCVNNGHIAAPCGREGGIVATVNTTGGQVTGCVNNGLVEDDIVGQYTGESYGVKRMGGLVGGNKGQITGCTNNGAVTSHLSCRTGGFVGHNEGFVKESTNRGEITGGISSNKEHGPGWACGYNKTKANVTGNFGYGKVNAKDANHVNAVFYNYKSLYNPEENTVDWTLDSYYDWQVDSTRALSAGIKYTAYHFENVVRLMNVLEIDLSSPEVDLTTAYSDELVPNPNANGNDNNGKKVRETLSEICNRRRAEGQNIVGGINTGFFDSNDGISRGFSVEEGEPIYINNPAVVAGLGNHAWGFTVFTDGSASCGKKAFTGKIELGSKEYSYYTVNDTTMRHSNPTYTINLYTSRYVETPHPKDLPNVKNPLAKNVLYLTAEYDADPMKVNAGWAEATVTAVADGRTTALANPPYLTNRKQLGIALSGAPASEVAAAVKVGDKIRVKCDIAIDGSTAKQIYTLNSTMFQILKDGKDNSESVPKSNQTWTNYDPITFPVVSQDGKKVWLVEIDGRSTSRSMGVKTYEMVRIAKKLGGWNMTRFDGGGSACMWMYNSDKAKGYLVNKPSDSKGERSCLNYILVRVK